MIKYRKRRAMKIYRRHIPLVYFSLLPWKKKYESLLKAYGEQQEMLSAEFVVRVNGEIMIGPFTLQDFYYILKYGGQKWHGAFLADLDKIS